MLRLPIDYLKEVLINDGLVTKEVFDEIISSGQRLGQDPAEIFISREIIPEDYYYSLLSKYFKVERITLSSQTINVDVLKLVPEDLARQRQAIVFTKEADESYDVAMADPSDLETIEFLTHLLKADVHPFLATSEDLSKGFSFYGAKSIQDFKKVIEENVNSTLASKTEKAEQAAHEVPVVAIVDNLLSYAISSRASDIHVEIMEDVVLVRYRIDGILREIIQIPKEIHPAIIARIKLLSSLKLDEHMKPQDGRFRYHVFGDVVDIRVSILPVYYGEKIVMRLLPATHKPLSFEELGLAEDMADVVRQNIQKSYGMIIVCGPTGSGKTTLLYSILSMLNRPGVNIVSIEDPIEYDMKYINQAQVNEAAGITFASGLRSILRQDPNIIFVGEIRDSETAEISVQAALTGHLLLSSLHTNDSTTAIPRLFDMGIQPFLVAAVLNMVVAKRLVRKICMSCIYSFEIEPETAETVKNQFAIIGSSDPIPKTIFKGRGCPACGHSGYHGRTSIYEILNMTNEIRKIVISPSFSLDALKTEARREGMITMFEDGIRKVERGVTTIEEVLRVIRE